MRTVMAFKKMNDFFNVRAETYDDHMLIDLGLDEFYQEIAKHINLKNPKPKLLDLGCGTGLELDRLFTKYPDISVTGIDMSSEMLNRLKEKYPDKNTKLICASYFDVLFDDNYDVVLSTYSLHHFNEAMKILIYQKVYNSLADDGVYVEGDYTAGTMDQQMFFKSELCRLHKEYNLTDEFYHYDTPLTVETQIMLLQSTGFQDVDLVRQWENTSIIVARK